MSLKPPKKGDIGTAWNRTKEKRKPKLDFRTKGKRFILLCEGRNTEPLYFKSFPLSAATVKVIGKGGRSKISLVEYGFKELEKLEFYDEDEIWFVFDMDIHYPEVSDQKADFNSAIKLAEVKGARIAFSNDCFEIWFLLHYQDLSGQLTRKEYYEKLNSWMGIDYEKVGKGRDFASKIYETLLKDTKASQPEAISRATRLWEENKHLPPADRNPCNSVYQLVVELNGYLN